MRKLGDFICKHKMLIIIATLVLLIPSLIGYIKTKVNYDILVYLPKDIETIQGENILTDDFNMGAYAIVVAQNMKSKDIIKLEDNIQNIEGVNKVASINDVTGTTIPVEFLPSEITDKVAKDDSTLILVTFNNSTSDDITLDAVEKIRNLVNDESKVGGMSAMVLDTKELFNSEMLLYVVIAVIFCIVVLTLSLDSYLVPFLLIANIGVAILFNMGTNIFFGDICYITKAIASVLQLGVTTDFSIFLYHKYEKAKKKHGDINKAMSEAISETLVSVLGSSLTTIAGFLALCTMNLKLGVDIGIVMAKGVLFGLLCVITLFPALLLVFDNKIEKTKHKEILPKFNIIKNFVMKHYKLIFIMFLLLLFPAYKAQQKTSVYYKLDESIPDDYGYTVATKALKDNYDIVSQELLLVPASTSEATMNEMVEKLENVEGINLVLSTSSLNKLGLDEDMLSTDVKNMLETNKYKMILVNSTYDIATDELNEQIKEVNDIVKSYDKNVIVAGEGPLMKDLVEITDQDFKNVNITSIAVIFVLMLLVLKSISLPILLVTAIEFAIFINMGVPYFTDTQIPFIASVVIGTIQLGATIDYAILLTTKYLEKRKSGKDKKEAVQSALNNSITSIFVSGMCFFAATIGVSIVSQIDMIGCLCTLISRGAIISMLVVMTIVPSILIIFDKIIVKTTVGFNKGGKNMKNKMIKATSLLLVFGMLFSVVPVNALTKDEVVYSKLSEDGKQKYTIVTEHLVNDGKSEIIDYSDLKNIENTNGNEKYHLENNRLTWQADKKDIYYKGTTDKKLPVTLDATYKLDGKVSTVKDMLGKKGNVEITLKYTNHEQHGNMYTPFVVVTNTAFDSTTTSNLKVVNGKVISNGQKYLVAGIAAPGLYESLDIDKLKGMDTITITYDTTKFELTSIYSIVTAKLLDELDLSKLDEVNGLYSKVDTLKQSTDKIQKGSKDLSNGMNDLTNGINSIHEGTDKLNSVLSQNIAVVENSNAIDDATLAGIKTQAKQAVTSTFTDQYKAQIGAQAVAGTKAKLEAQVQQATGYPAQAACANTQDATLLATCGTITALGDATSSLYQMIAGTAASSAQAAAESTAENTAEKIATNVADTAKESSVKSLKELNANISKINEGVKSASDGASKLNAGAKELSDGIEKFSNEGINKIVNFINGDLKASTTKIKELQKLAREYDTFTKKDESAKGNTKFILVIDGQKVKKETKKVKKEVKKESFIDKIINLFK